jgi:CRISPR/Cas system endoribonuclease Cas6 (RAMP superfamily)
MEIQKIALRNESGERVVTCRREVQTRAFKLKAGPVCLGFFFWLRITLQLVIKMTFMFLSLCDLMRITGVGRMKPI